MAEKSETRRVGRPSKMQKEAIDEILNLIEAGFNRREICREVQIHHSTFYSWLNKNIEFREAVVEMEKESERVRRFRRWENHPYRGKRPPRGSKKADGAYPVPFGKANPLVRMVHAGKPLKK